MSRHHNKAGLKKKSRGAVPSAVSLRHQALTSVPRNGLPLPCLKSTLLSKHVETKWPLGATQLRDPGAENNGLTEANVCILLANIFPSSEREKTTPDFHAF